MAKYNQKEETKYFNNEFDNMPSIDYRSNCEWMNKRNLNKLEWDKILDICQKYGFDCTQIHNTFSGDDVRLIVYKKALLTHEQYKEIVKNKQYDKLFEEEEKCENIFKRLHECVHELDEETNLMFDTGWSGNCGRFGSMDVKRQSYSFGSHFSDWDFIIDRWSPYIHDTARKLTKGVYIMIESHYFKETFE